MTEHKNYPEGLVGRANTVGADLFRNWFSELNDVAERDEGAAYVFVMGSLNEVLKTFDLPVTFPEINSLQTAVRRVAPDLPDLVAGGRDEERARERCPHLRQRPHEATALASRS